MKIFRRVATFDDARDGTMQQKKSGKANAVIELPKKSRTFVDQSLRERENPKLLHQVTFFNDDVKGELIFESSPIKEIANYVKIFLKMCAIQQIYQRNWFMVKWHATKTFAELKAGQSNALFPSSIGADSEPIQVKY